MTKKIPPIIIILLIVLYIISIGLAIALEDGFTMLSLIVIIVVSLITGALVATLISRMKEINDENDDELKKY